VEIAIGPTRSQIGLGCLEATSSAIKSGLHCVVGCHRQCSLPLRMNSLIIGASIPRLALPLPIFGFGHGGARKLFPGDPASEEFCSAVVEIFDYLLRSEVALKLMRPFAEGLAQYAEYDLIPGQSRLLSETAGWILRTFLPVDMSFSDEKEMLTILCGIMSDNRMGEKLQLRKEDLLVSQLDCKDGGYLAGYMAVKNLRFTLLTNRKCTHLVDQDLYLGFIRSFIYEDYGFVDVLLGPGTIGL
jgi:hypothetical protein